MSEAKILSRVRKMMAIANDAAASEGERDNALRMAYNVLAKYNLTMVDVEIHTAEGMEKREIFQTVTRSQLWSRHVCNIVAELFFCKYFSGARVNADKCVHHFVGKESNATTAMLMSEFIVQSLVKESRRLYKNDLTPEARSFCLGAVNKLRERVRELREEQETENNKEVTGTALVLASLYKTEADANALVVQGSGVSLHTSKGGKKTVKREAYAAGKEYGEGISLNTQLGSKKRSGSKMNPFILSYLQAEGRLRIAREKLASTLALAKTEAQPVGALRVATPADIVVGAVLWYRHDFWIPDCEEKEYYWQTVRVVHCPTDPWKAYTAHSGRPYGLEGAKVEVP